MANPQPFYVAGGTLSPNVPSYVTRPADQELFELAQQGQYCYVLTSRQMGKSSLMVRTARKLEQAGLKTATIDLTALGNLTEETWYFDLVDELTEQLDLSLDLETWWEAQGTIGLTRRFKKFLRDVVLVELSQPIVIFIDEIDFTLQLPFSDSFFVTIRALYNERATNPLFNRLTFILIGSATPSDFIKDPSSTPFNIGQAVMLGDIEYTKSQQLQQGLETVYPGQGQLIFERIYHWTDGHPYLSQKLCQEVINANETTWTPEQVDTLINQIFLSETGQKEQNLQFVRDKVLNNDHRAAMLKLYRRIYKGEKIAENSRDLSQSQLKLAGLIKPMNGQLYVRNQIYRQVFDKSWVNRYLEWNWGLITSGVLGSLLTLIILLGAGLYGYDSNVADQARRAELAFYQIHYPTEQAKYLANLFELEGLWFEPSHDYKAKELFFTLSAQEQLELFDIERTETQNALIIAKGIYPMLADVENNDNGTRLLEKMADMLGTLEPNEEVTPLKTEIEAWLQGRAFRKQGQYQQAVAEYNKVIKFNNQNLATLYERADTLSQLQNYPAALNDLENIMAIAAQSALPTSTPAPIVRVTPSSTPTSSPTATATPTVLTTTATPRVTETSITNSTAISETLQLIKPQSSASQNIPPVKPQLMSIAQIVEAVRILQIRHPDLLRTLTNNQNSNYPNLQKFGLVPPSSTCSVTIQDLSFSPKVMSVNEFIDLTINTDNPDGLDIQYKWSVTDGTLSFGSSDTIHKVAVYSSPDYPGNQTITVIILPIGCEPIEHVLQIIVTESVTTPALLTNTPTLVTQVFAEINRGQICNNKCIDQGSQVDICIGSNFRTNATANIYYSNGKQFGVGDLMQKDLNNNKKCLNNVPLNLEMGSYIFKVISDDGPSADVNFCVDYC